MIPPDETCKALADRNRMRILTGLLNHNDLCACQINEWLAVSGATASKHLGILIRADLIQSRKEGRWVFYKMKKADPINKKLMLWIKETVSGDPDLQRDLKQLRKVTSCSPNKLRERQRKEAATCC